ncbi:MAG: hypothetical protein RJA44_1761 [Pseudomonadota bacterium]
MPVPVPAAPEAAKTDADSGTKDDSDTDSRMHGDIGMSYSRNRTAYVSYRFATDIDLTRKQPGQELLTEVHLLREDIQAQGQSSTTVSTDQYDASLKLKRFYADEVYYLYGSPRIQYNRFDFYKTSQALRLGAGRRFKIEPMSLDLELGGGHRWAQGHDGAEISEALSTFTARLEYNFSKSMYAKLNLVIDRTSQEHNSLFTASLNSPLVGNLYMKYEMSYRRILPLDNTQPSSETSYNFGLGYRL